MYQVDARKQGTNGRRETFSTQKEAEKRAREIESDTPLDKSLGGVIPAHLRFMAMKCDGILAAHGKTLQDATDFYVKHLLLEEKKAGSATVGHFATEWLNDKKTGKEKELRKDTIDSIRETARTLVLEFGSLRILDVTTDHISDYLNKLNCKHQRRANIRSLISQFFNWVGNKRKSEHNPAKDIKITIPPKEPEILSADGATKLMRLVEAKYQDLGLYSALCLFAGIRPKECERLRIEDIDFHEKRIIVRANRAKVKETREIPIEPNLLEWIELFLKGKTSGEIIRSVGLRTKLEKMRGDLGFRVNGRNGIGKRWPEDILRHSYASYWLAVHKDRPRLAEYMGNSASIIGKRYKKIVSPTNAATFWNIRPLRAAWIDDNPIL